MADGTGCRPIFYRPEARPMKNRPLVYGTISAAIFLFSQTALSATDFSWSITPEVDWHYGQQSEFVFTNNPDGKEVKLSQLDWDEKGIPLGKITFGASLERFDLGLTGTAGIPGTFGVVQDYDWFNTVEYVSIYNKVSLENTRNPDIASVITNYSYHNNFIHSYYGTELKASYAFDVEGGHRIKPFLSADFTYTGFTAAGGEKSYGKFDTIKECYYSYDDPDESHLDRKHYSDDKVILELDRRYYNIWIGSDFDMAIGNRFNATLDMALLGFSYVNSLDTHAVSIAYYKDKCSGFFCGAKISLEGKFIIDEKQHLFLKAGYKASSVIKGKSSGSHSKKGYYTEYTDSWAGSSFWSGEIAAGYSIQF